MSTLKVLDDVRLAPNERVVAHLEQLLERAKSGNLQGLVVLYDGVEESGFGFTEVGTWDTARALLTLKCWEHRLMHHHMDERERRIP